MKIHDDINVKHPWFDYCTVGAYPFTFIFTKPRHTRLNPKKVADYKRRAQQVEKLGGYMRQPMEKACARALKPFTKAEVEAAQNAILKSNPSMRIIAYWNGIGCFTLSVGAEAKKDKKYRRPLTEPFNQPIEQSETP